MKSITIHESGIPNPSAKVFFIHGITGSPLATWNVNGVKEKYGSWITSLPKDLPYTDIYSIGYDSSIFSNESITFDDYSLQLVSIIEDDLNTENIFFICHSMGGIIAKNVVKILTENPKLSKSKLRDCSFHYVFFGTPHLGADSEIEKFRVLFRSKSLFKQLMPKNPILKTISAFFSDYVKNNRPEVECFYETKKCCVTFLR